MSKNLGDITLQSLNELNGVKIHRPAAKQYVEIVKFDYDSAGELILIGTSHLKHNNELNLLFLDKVSTLLSRGYQEYDPSSPEVKEQITYIKSRIAEQHQANLSA